MQELYICQRRLTNIVHSMALKERRKRVSFLKQLESLIQENTFQCLDYGKDWNNLAILEVEADLEKIIVPDDCTGKVRCLEVKVLREVPLEECGIYGKMIANRLNKEREKDA